jgi:hypothetical protein
MPDYPTNIPPELSVTCEAIAYQGEGVQIYQCTPEGRWAFQSPRASLRDDNGNLAAEHFAGPTWQAADGSTVVGRKIAESTPDPDAVPWLLLEAASNTGNGIFSAVRFIQRLATAGGTAPTESCHGSALIEVPYTALYVFYALRRNT